MDSDTPEADTTGSTLKHVTNTPATNATIDHKEEKAPQDTNVRREREAAFSDYIVCRVKLQLRPHGYYISC